MVTLFERIYEPLHPDYRVYRDFLKHLPEESTPEDYQTDQELAKPCLPVEKPISTDVLQIPLPAFSHDILKKPDILSVLQDRISRRVFKKTSLELEALAFLLWATQGVRKVVPVKNGKASLRTTPSAGARHPFETYLVVRNVTGLEKGIYRYLPLENTLAFLKPGDFSNETIEACAYQRFCGLAPVTFFWSVLPYRTEWRYAYISHKVIALDAGHVCQNLYIACEALGLGTCAIGAYDQEKADQLLNLDGSEEFVLYIAPVGNY